MNLTDATSLQKKDTVLRNGPRFEHELTTIGNVLAVTYTHNSGRPLAHLNRQGDEIAILGITDSGHILGWTENWVLKTTIDLSAHHREVRRQRALNRERRIERRRLRALRRAASEQLAQARQRYAQVFANESSSTPDIELEPYDVLRARVLRGLRDAGARVDNIDAPVSDDSAGEEEEDDVDGDLPYTGTDAQSIWDATLDQTALSTPTAAPTDTPNRPPISLSLSLDALDELMNGAGLGAKTATAPGTAPDSADADGAGSPITPSAPARRAPSARSAAATPFCLLCAAWIGGSTALAVTGHGRVVEYEVTVPARDAARDSPAADVPRGPTPELSLLQPPPTATDAGTLAALAAVPQRPPPLLVVTSTASRNAPLRPISSAHLPHLFPHLARSKPAPKPALASPRRAAPYAPGQPYGLGQSSLALPQLPDASPRRTSVAAATGRATLADAAPHRTSLAAAAATRLAGLSPPPQLPSLTSPYTATRAPRFQALGAGLAAPAHASLVELPRLCCAAGGLLLVCAGASLYSYDPSR